MQHEDWLSLGGVLALRALTGASQVWTVCQ
jgi:hypothetical protein